jgi:hypothetical protein
MNYKYIYIKAFDCRTKVQICLNVLGTVRADDNALPKAPNTHRFENNCLKVVILNAC